MASKDALTSDRKFLSQNPFRRSEPFQYTQQWGLTPQSNRGTRVRSMYDVITPFQHGVARQSELVLPRSQSPLSFTEKLPEKLSVRCSEIELSNDSSSIASSVKPSGRHHDDWRPSYYRIGPLIGLTALVLAFSQILASYAVLKASDGRPVADWKFTPSVYIAVLTTLSNGAISYASVRGAVITFWQRCLQGTTLGQMHRDWAYGLETLYALWSGRHVNLLALACIFATLVCIDGAFLQRASSTQIVTSGGPVNLNVSVVPEIPSYFSGSYCDDPVGAEFSNAMLPVMNEYSSNQPIIGGIEGCIGSCTATIRAPALIVDHCESTVTEQNFSAPYTSQETALYHEGQFPATRTLFATYLTSSNGTAETLDLQTFFTGAEVAATCAGPFNSTNCYLRSAIAEYEVTMTNGTIILLDAANPKFVSWANNTAITNETIYKFGLHNDQNPGCMKTTLAAIVNAFLFKYYFSGDAYPPKHSKPGYLDISLQSQSLFMYQHITNYAQYNNETACTYTFNDPRSSIMAGLNELMFRIGVHVGQNYNSEDLKSLLDPGVQTNYSVIGAARGPQEVFKSEFAYFFAAAGLELLTIVLVASTFIGYWRLGRHVSFSPLEIAKAFDAPLLADIGPNLSGRNIAKATNDRQVKYGLVYDDAEKREAGTLKLSHRIEVHALDRQSVAVQGTVV